MHLFVRLVPRHHCRQLCTYKREPGNEAIHGWARNVRKAGDRVYVQLDLGNGSKAVPVVTNKDKITGEKLQVGSALTAYGELAKDAEPGVGRELGFHAERVDVVGTDSNPRYDMSADSLRKNTHLRARNSKFAALLRARSALSHETHEFFRTRSYVQIDTPKLTKNDCEGGGEVFYVTTSSEEAAEDPMSLSVSSQLHLEAMANQLGAVYTLGPAFRAEKQQSHAHLSEFYMLEAELSFVNDLESVTDIVEEYVNKMITLLHTQTLLKSLVEQMGCTPPRLEITEKHYPRIRYEDAVSLLNSIGEKVTAKSGLSKKNELRLVELHNDGPVFVTDFPADQKPFYMARDGNKSLSFDLLVPGVGELAGGSLRETDPQELVERGCNIDWYLELRRRGQPPTGGFGIGFERLLQFLFGIHNIKDTIAFPRWHRHCQC